METLSTVAGEESTYIVTCTFTDEDDVAMTPNTVTWQLTDMRGNVINNRTAVSEAAAEVVNIVLSGDDLSLLTDTNDTTRIVTVWGTYDSATYGNGLKYTDEVRFAIENYVGIT